MGTTLSNLSPPPGARKKSKRLGRGSGSGKGTTAGKGTKGQLSRSGITLGRGFEGGQMPLQRRLPKRGFKNPFRVEFAPVNVGRLSETFEAGQVVDPDLMRAQGLVPRKAKLLKVLGSGQISHAITVKAHAFSKSARDKIQTAGGSVEVIQLSQPVPKEPDTQRTPEAEGVESEQG